jgi:hypothetical protein
MENRDLKTIVGGRVPKGHRNHAKCYNCALKV